MSKNTEQRRKALADVLLKHAFGHGSGKGAPAPDPIPLEKPAALLNWGGAGQDLYSTDWNAPDPDTLEYERMQRLRGK